MMKKKINEYPVIAKNCEVEFIEGDFELICGKRNIYGEWILCPKCRRLKENKRFLEKEQTSKNGDEE